LPQDDYDIALCWKDTEKVASLTLAKKIKINNPKDM